MELKEFITETISAIIQATEELKQEFKEAAVVITPPAALSGSDVYKDGSGNYVYRHVKDVNFDVAVTIGNDAEGSGRAGIKVFQIEVGAGGKVTASSEQVSRVQFAIPIAMTNSEAEQKNLAAREANLVVKREAKNKKGKRQAR